MGNKTERKKFLEVLNALQALHERQKKWTAISSAERAPKRKRCCESSDDELSSSDSNSDADSNSDTDSDSDSKDEEYPLWKSQATDSGVVRFTGYSPLLNLLVTKHYWKPRTQRQKALTGALGGTLGGALGAGLGVASGRRW
ncbi:hypothetical protein FN846DRAFT_888735 [Sphaerosporella brunnea]|uniref:Uncharacterized protein n=1 Tax=Sphaerosporella brunnea TaxID=1250544 RepID=A0A5J5F1V5_9PEZI|nr:hypothetical protein FN846DRAFT_888735 [Sphaerosporella brunnea]